MEDISKNEALSLLSTWERQNHAIFVMCSSPCFALSSNNARLEMCLDDCIFVSFADHTGLKLFLSEEMFSRVGPQDFPAETLKVFPRFEEGINIYNKGRELVCYLLACESPGSKVDF